MRYVDSVYGVYPRKNSNLIGKVSSSPRAILSLLRKSGAVLKKNKEMQYEVKMPDGAHCKLYLKLQKSGTKVRLRSSFSDKKIQPDYRGQPEWFLNHLRIFDGLGCRAVRRPEFGMIVFPAEAILLRDPDVHCFFRKSDTRGKYDFQTRGLSIFAGVELSVHSAPKSLQMEICSILDVVAKRLIGKPSLAFSECVPIKGKLSISFEVASDRTASSGTPILAVTALDRRNAPLSWKKVVKVLGPRFFVRS